MVPSLHFLKPLIQLHGFFCFSLWPASLSLLLIPVGVCVYRCFLSFAPQKEKEDHQLHPTKTPPTSPTTLSQSFNMTKREQAHKPLRGGEKRAPKTSHLTQSPTVTAQTQQQKEQQ
jgi:hypothetical protein